MSELHLFAWRVGAGIGIALLIILIYCLMQAAGWGDRYDDGESVCRCHHRAMVHDWRNGRDRCGLCDCQDFINGDVFTVQDRPVPYRLAEHVTEHEPPFDIEAFERAVADVPIPQEWTR